MAEFNLRPDFAKIPNVKYSYNINSLLDISTGVYLQGKYNESILNGGLGNISGVVGIGNNFKTAITTYMMLSAMSKFPGSTASTYDTEVNISEARMKELAENVKEFNGEDIIENGRWTITDKTAYFGNEWFEKLKEFMQSKTDNAKKITVESPFLDRDGKALLPMLIPTFTMLDSLTKFDTESSNSMQEDNELGDSGANTLYMKEGQAKKRMLSYLPKPVQQSNNYMLITAHVGKNIPMDPRAAPVKKLQFLKNNDTLKGVTDDFTFLTTNCWQCQNATPLFNDSTKGPEYPRHSSDNMKGDTDLFIVTLVQLRSKTGPSGLVLQLIVSQQEGVLPGLTEFHYIKNNDRYGLNGSLQNYSLDLLPDVKLSRTTVRGKLEENVALRRAMTITAEMCQMKYLWHDLPDGLLITPAELRQRLTDKGYDVDWLLANCRSWWTYNNDKHPIPFLSTMDMLRAALKQEDYEKFDESAKLKYAPYHPYWLEDDKRTIKKEFQFKK
jgi:hypothetical protein